MGSIFVRKSTFLWLVCLVFSCVYRNGGAVAERSSKHAHAYAIMMYMGTPRDYEFYIAIRVMMRSLLKVNADLVIIESKDVPLDWGKTLFEDGARVVYVDNIDNPYKNQIDFDK